MAAPVDHPISEGSPHTEETPAAQEQREEPANDSEDEEDSSQEEDSGENSGQEESSEDSGDEEEAGEERIVRTVNYRDYELEPISEKGAKSIIGHVLEERLKTVRFNDGEKVKVCLLLF
ncbi:major centromere autoantigen B-like [Pistacia vera]|uniref:major centromere autoantigen B-like n=1 Tax=Pistacia vera TaxID=55513 RepID=UPI001263E473|nr:major centromere autoantigen B-like [Pistacia vera]